MIPILYPATETIFATHGLGDMADAVSCFVTEERNGEYELEMEYPITGWVFGNVQTQNIILAKPNVYDDPQPFRIYAISRPLDGVVTINARHLSYDLSGIIVALPYTVVDGYQVPHDIETTNVSAAFAAMVTNSRGTNNFSFTTDVATTASFRIDRPMTFRQIMGGVEGSILDVFGGEYSFDKWEVRLNAHRGEDRGFSIRYGKNLTDINQEEECANCYTGVMCYYGGEDGRKEGAVQSTGLELGYSRNLLIDVTDDYDAMPTVGELNRAAQTYISSHDLTAPKVSMSVSYQQVEGVEYERISLCDTVHVYFELLGVDTTAKVVRTHYNVLLERYEKVEIGSIRANIAGAIAEVEKKVSEKVTKSSMEAAVQRATSLITGNSGGYVVTILDANGEPTEFCVMDTNDINTATKVWRWNSSGLGYSKTGYDGYYELAMTREGEIVANVITTGKLQSGDGQKFVLDVATGDLVVQNPTIQFGESGSYTTMNQYIDRIGDNTEAIDNISGYLRYANGVVTIGDAASLIALQVQNDRISFYDVGANRELAFFSDQRLHVSNITIENSLDFGDYSILTSNGGLSFKWRDS